MSKFGKTKREIITLLTKQQQTLTDLSAKLGLSPSTVKQHLEELEAMGAIVPVQNEFIRRWKYYRSNPTFDAAAVAEVPEHEFSRFMPYLLGAIVLIAVAGIYFSGIITANPASASSPGGASLVSVRLTDPPFVPSGTTALYINYSSVQLHAIGTGNSWIQGKGSGTIDLLSLINTSQVIGNVYLDPNTTIDKIRFNITAARIVIGNVSYPVSVPTGQVTAQLPQDSEISANESLLLDFSPTIAPVYNGSIDTFVMLPSVKAAMLGNEPDETDAPVGRVFVLAAPERMLLNGSAEPCAILNASATVLNDSTSNLTFTVKNTGNSSVEITHVVLLGPIRANFTGFGAASDGAYPPMGPSSMIAFVHVKVFSMIQGWLQPPFPGPELAFRMNSGNASGVLMFTIQHDGSVLLPFTQADFEDVGNVLAPGQSATLSFNQTISIGDGSAQVNLIPNSTYRLMVVGTYGSVASANFTST